MIYFSMVVACAKQRLDMINPYLAGKDFPNAIGQT
jgi:hypothetical protein